MKLPPAVMIHGLEHARAALAPGLPVALLSGPGAGAYAGVGWWQALMAQAGAIGTPHILDCGVAPGRALEALRAGQSWLVLRAEPRVFADLAERGAMLGATVAGSGVGG
jgi:hypothetical protein